MILLLTASSGLRWIIMLVAHLSARYLHNFYLLLASFILMLVGNSLIPALPRVFSSMQFSTLSQRSVS